MSINRKKLQVFVSSTFLDLQEERQAAVQAILSAGHIPAGMELFIAGDESQWEIIKEWIGESDIYMLIIGGRYGSIEEKSGKSYTHLEYDYAISKNKPHFVIVIDDKLTQFKAKNAKHTTEFFDNSQKLEEFKVDIMKGKLVAPCKNSDQIESSVLKSINKLAQRENLIGWVRDDRVNLDASLEELARLSKENSELKDELAKYKGSEKINGIEIGEFALLLKNKKLDGTFFSIDGVHVDNYLYFFYYSTIHYLNIFRQYDIYETPFLNTLKDFYGLLEANNKPTDMGKKLLTYLELNLHLLEENYDSNQATNI